jgi:hypothetical protein
MPKFDGTGPQGMGPKTGRGMGSCQKDLRIKLGACSRFGLSRGQGLKSYFNWNNTKTTAENIRGYEKALEEELQDVSREISNLQKRD